MKATNNTFRIFRNELKSIYTSLAFIVFSTLSYAQWSDCSKQELSDLILKMDQKVASAKSYSYTAKQYFFNDSLSIDTAFITDFSMLYNNKKELLNIQQMGVTLVQDAVVQIKCDSSSKQLFVQDADKAIVNLGVTRGFESFLKSNTAVYKKNNGLSIVYKLIFDKGTKYSCLELWVNPKDLVVNKYILYSGKEILDDGQETETWIKPRMEVVIDKYVFAEKAETTKTSKISDYFTSEELTVPRVQFADYEVIDLRKKTK